MADPRVLIVGAGPTAAQNLDPHRPMTLKKARLKVTRFAKYHASDKTALVGCVP